LKTTKLENSTVDLPITEAKVVDSQHIQREAMEAQQQVEALQKTVQEQKAKLDEQNRLVQHQEIQNLSNKIAELTTSLKATEVRAQALQQQEKTLTGQNQGTRNQTSYDYGIVRFQNHDTGPG
jgi:predicted RNase H-like nuclease (RuvC/YqgF family)